MTKAYLYAGRLGFVALATFLGFWVLRISEIKETKHGVGEHPGYFEQWYQEKKSADGTIPRWMRSKWAAWDRSNVRNRASEDIIDTVFELGPKSIGGRTRAIWVDPRNDQHILAAAINGGVWRSETGGASWLPLNDHETSLMPSCFTHSPFNPDLVYYGTGEGRLAFPAEEDVAGNGVYKSTNGGKTFAVIPSTVGLQGFDVIWDIEHSPTDSNTIFVGTNSKGLYRTKDAGQTWEQVLSTGTQRVTSILILPGDRVLITMIGNQMYASDSGGKKGTFAAVSTSPWPTAGTYGRIELANCKSFPNVVYALVSNSADDTARMFLKSSDGGRTWKRRSTPKTIGSGYQNYCVMIGVNPLDSNVVVTGGVNIAQSNNGGSTWAAKTTGHADHQCFASFYSSFNIYFLIGTDGGVYRYKYSSGAVNATLNTGYQVTQFYAGNFGPTGLVSISGSQDNGTHVANGVLNTKKFYGGDGGFAHIGLQDGTVAYFSTQVQHIYRVDNFDPAAAPSFFDYITDTRFESDGVSFINSYTMNPADQGQLYYRTNKYVYRSTNSGNSWTPISNTHSSIKPIGVSAHGDPTIYYGGGAGQLYKIDNALNAVQGAEVSYNLVVPTAITNDFINSIAVHPEDRYTIFLAFSSYNTASRLWRVSGLDSAKPVFKSIGDNLPPSLPINYVAVDPAFPDKNIFVGSDFGLYYSTDSGNTWTKELRIPNVPVHEIKMRSDRLLFIYTHGRGMWCAALVGSGSVKKVKSEPMAHIYPNPAKGFVQIDLNKQPKNASVSIYNSAGKLVRTEKLVNKNTRVDIQQFGNGFYFAQIRNEEETYTSKILVKN